MSGIRSFMQPRVMDPETVAEDEWFEGGSASGTGAGPREIAGAPTLRPLCFEDYPGQEQVKENLKVYVEAAKKKGDTPRPCDSPRASGLGEDHPGTHRSPGVESRLC